MSEEVKIVVKQETRGDAIKKAEAELERLKALEAKYQQTLPEAVSSVRSERVEAQKKVNALVREQAAEERAITKEKTKQAAEEKLTSSRRQRLVGAVANFAESQAGAGGFGGITSALGAMGGPAGIITAAVVATATAIGAAFARQGRERELIGLRNDTAEAVQGRGLSLLAKKGDYTQAKSEAEAARSEVVGLEGKRKELQKEAEFKWWSPSSWMDKVTGASENALKENQNDIGRALQKERDANDIAKSKEDVGPKLGIQIMEERIKGHMKEARALEFKKLRADEYHRLIGQHAPEADANRGADLAVEMEKKKWQQNIGQSLSWKSGAAQVAQAISIAREGFGGPAPTQAIEKLHMTVQKQHMDAIGHMDREKITQRRKAY